MDSGAADDTDLIQRARAGERAAFGCLLERYRPMVLRAAMRMVGHAELARDLAQETMLQAYLSLDHLREETRFKAWLYGIALNVCRNFIREQRAQSLSLEAMAGGTAFDTLPVALESSSPHEIAEARELRGVVRAAIDALPPAERQAAWLFYFEQLSLQEIAAALGISIVAAKGRLYKSRKHLRALLRPLAVEDNRQALRSERINQMIKVSVSDVVVQEQKVEWQEQPVARYVVALLDEERRRILPIWVGSFEGQAIATGLRQYALPRPMTMTFLWSVLAASGGVLEEVRIESLKGDTFYAIAKVRGASSVSEIDARPSDALALAVRAGCPVYVAPDVMDRAGASLPAGAQLPAGHGVDSIIKDLDEGVRASQSLSKTTRTPEELEKSRQELVTLLLGGVLGND
jgi:RNA polymerase sigma factor (sigma-70 family)